MFRRLRQVVAGASLPVRAGLIAIAVGVYLFLSWFIADRFWKEGGWGLFCAFWAGWLSIGFFISGPTRIVYIRALVAFIIAAPIVYVLVLITQLTLLVGGLTHFSTQEYFVKGILGTLGGVGGALLLGMKATFKKSLDEMTNPYGHRWDITELAQIELWGFLPLGIGAALLVTVPASPLARIILSIFWGLFAAICCALVSTLIQREPVTEAVLYVGMAEVMMIIILIANVLQGVFGKHFFDVPKIYEGLELAVPAAITCAGVYLLVYLCAVMLNRAKGAASQAAGESSECAGSPGTAAQPPDIPEEPPGELAAPAAGLVPGAGSSAAPAGAPLMP